MGRDECTWGCVDKGVWIENKMDTGRKGQNYRKRELGKTEKRKGEMERYRNGIGKSWRVGQRKMEKKKREREGEKRGEGVERRKRKSEGWKKERKKRQREIR